MSTTTIGTLVSKHQCEFRVIKGFEDYCVSDTGIVAKIVSGKNLKAGDVVWQGLNVYGYVVVNLHANRKQYSKRVHRLVLEAFIGESPTTKHEAAHNDGDKKNNCLSNLRWATSVENCRDRVTHGTSPVGVKNPSSKLNDESVRAIRELALSKKYTQKQIGDMFGVVHTAISEVLRNRNWSHV